MPDLETGCIHTGDAFEVLPSFPAASVHAVVTDPPYGLNFMSEDWDNFRRKHNTADSGRDCVFGRMSSTAPASGAETDSKRYQEWTEKWARAVKRVLRPGGHLLAFSGNRTHHRAFSGIEDAGFEIRDTLTWHYSEGFPKGADAGDGFNSQLKPATEFVAAARKPLAEDTVAENVHTHGTGAYNIAATRVAYRSDADQETTEAKNPGRDDLETSTVYGADRPQQQVSDDGRYPANVVFDETEAKNVPSRYFYTSKASTRERTNDGAVPNDHPTVKPVDLMEWLVKLVTARDQIVCDPFCGSGTTGIACKHTDRRFVGIEQDPTYADTARARIGLTPEDPSRFRDPDSGQTGLGEFGP